MGSGLPLVGRCPWIVGALRDITAQASQRPCLRARSGWCWFLTARLSGHDDGAISSIRGGIEVALPIEDRLERHGVFISHITDGKPTEVWRKA